MSNMMTTVKNSISSADYGEYINGIIIILLIIYVSYTPKHLTPFFVKLYNNFLFKFITLILIAYAATKSPAVAIIAAISFIVTLSLIQNDKHKKTKKIIKKKKCKNDIPCDESDIIDELPNHLSEHTDSKSLAQAYDDKYSRQFESKYASV